MNYTFLIYKMTGVPVIVTNDLLVALLLGMATGWRKAEKILPVSYTHLTLPTIA